MRHSFKFNIHPLDWKHLRLRPSSQPKIVELKIVCVSWQRQWESLSSDISNFIPFAFVVCCLLDLVAKLFSSWASENLGTCSADVEGVSAPDSVSRWRRRRRMQDHISDFLCFFLCPAANLSWSLNLCLFILHHSPGLPPLSGWAGCSWSMAL